MIARLAMLGAVWLISSGSQVSCSSGDTSGLPGRDIEDSGDGPTFATTLVLLNSAGVETYEFARGEIIRFELTVRNRTDSPVELETGAYHYDFVVFDSGRNTPRWLWSEDRAFTMEGRVLTFAPDESKVFTADWNQETAAGSALARGRYEARGVLPFDAFRTNRLASHELGSTLRAFRVN
jgi:hypothetical protein